MFSTEYLYGIKPEALEGMEYYSALEYKYNHGVKLYQKLYLKENKTEEENIRIFHVEKAVRHTKRLMDERDENGFYHYHGDFKPKVHDYDCPTPRAIYSWEGVADLFGCIWRWFRELFKR